MKASPKRHVLALLRLEIGLGQKEMGEIAGCSRATIQAVELGHLKLSESLAMRISKTTGVDLAWLLKNDLTAPPIAVSGNPYQKYHFESFQAQKNIQLDERSIDAVPSYLFGYYIRLRAIFASACKKGELDRSMAFYKLDRAIDALRKEFGSETAIDPRQQEGPSFSTSELDLVEHDLHEARAAFEKHGVELEPKPNEKSLADYREWRRKHELPAVKPRPQRKAKGGAK